MNYSRLTGFSGVFVLAIALLLTTTNSVADETSIPSGQFGVEVDFDVSANNGTYTCTAVVSDLANGEVVAAPRVTASIGEEAVAVSRMQLAEESFKIVLTFFADKTSANYVLEVKQGENLVAKQKSSLKL